MYPVIVESVSKSFRRHAYRNQFRTLKSVLLGRDRAGAVGKGAWIEALKEVSFRVDQGTTLGIIGSNGSGKSTMLKVVAGISRPTSGTVETRGRIAALIELGAGFHPEISGRENVYINGIMLGLTKQEIARRFEEIVRFAELEDFIDAPVKTYSSGMYMRLGFSVAVHVNPEILLIDEILAVGDEAFSHKCIERIRDFQRRKKTIILVSHALDMVEGLCDRVIWLKGGVVQEQGDPRRVVDAYLLDVAGKEDAEMAGLAAGSSVTGAAAGSSTTVDEGAVEGESGSEDRGAPSGGQDQGAGDEGTSEPERRRWGTREVEITSVKFLDGGGEERFVYRPGEVMEIQTELDVRLEKEPDVVFGVGIFDAGGVCCFGTNTDIEGIRPSEVAAGPQSFSFRIERLDLVEGNYFLDLAVHRKDGYAYDYHRGLYTFRVRSRIKEVGIASLRHRWAFSDGISFDDSDGSRDETAGSRDSGGRRSATMNDGTGSAAGGEADGAATAAVLLEETGRLIEQARRDGKRIVFTNGCFDILHGGHLHVLERSRAEGGFLVVGLNDDDSIRRLKGPERPIMPLAERRRLLLALDCVDAVIPFAEDTPLELIRTLRPDVLVKGGDWEPEQIVGREDVESWGGRVETVPLVEGKATTAIVERILQRYGGMKNKAEETPS